VGEPRESSLFLPQAITTYGKAKNVATIWRQNRVRFVNSMKISQVCLNAAALFCKNTESPPLGASRLQSDRLRSAGFSAPRPIRPRCSLRKPTRAAALWGWWTVSRPRALKAGRTSNGERNSCARSVTNSECVPQAYYGCEALPEHPKMKLIPIQVESYAGTKPVHNIGDLIPFRDDTRYGEAYRPSAASHVTCHLIHHCSHQKLARSCAMV